MTTTERTIKYKHIGAFARHMDVTRSRAYQALEGEDPDWWEAYAEYVAEHAKKRAARVRAAKAQVRHLQTTTA